MFRRFYIDYFDEQIENSYLTFCDPLMFLKLFIVLWVGLSACVAYYTDSIRIFLTSSEVIRPVFNISLTLLSMNFCFMLYLGFYLPKIKGLKDSSAWEVYCPRVIPMMTFNGVISTALLLRSCWPVWVF